MVHAVSGFGYGVEGDGAPVMAIATGVRRSRPFGSEFQRSS